MKVKNRSKGTDDSVDGGVNYANTRKLWVDVLKLAVLDLQEKDFSLNKEAYKFIESNDPRFPSFVSICKVLDFAPDKIRNQLFTKKVTKKSFMFSNVRCCECGGYYQMVKMKKLYSCGMYVCKSCDSALEQDQN